jgi:LacI family transcriptional regulator
MKQKKATMALIADKAGVSITTVSHVINHTRHVNQSTKDIILQLIEEHDYHAAKTNKKQVSDNICIGVILADSRGDFFSLMVKALEMLADEYSISAIFCDSEADYEKEIKNINLLVEKKVDGILLAPVFVNKKPPILENISIPVVLFDRQYKSHSFLAIGINNFQSAYMGTTHLFNKGCKNVGFIGHSEAVYTILQRILGFKSAVQEKYSAIDPDVLYLKYSGGDSYPMIKEYLSHGKFDGILCATSSICYELIEVIDTLDDEAKNKIQIICFDDNRWFDYLKYPVSVITQPVVEIANSALENILQLIEHPDEYHGKRELFFDVSIIDR